MSDTDNPRAVIGGNRPPPYDPDRHQALADRLKEFSEASADWLKLTEIETEEEAAALTDQITGLRALNKEIDAERVAQKKPHDDAGKAVQAAFAPLIETVDRTVKKLLALQAGFLKKKQAEEDARKKAELEKARLEKEAAEKALAEAKAKGDIAAEIAAEEAEKAAAAAAKAASRTENAKVGSASGAGRTIALRTVKEAAIVNPRAFFLAVQEDAEIMEALQRVANRMVRASDYEDGAVPGIKVVLTQVAA